MSLSASRSPSRASSRGAGWRALRILGWLALLPAAGCSFLLDVDGVQCVADSDCESAGLTGTCEQGVCVELSPEPPACDGGACAPEDSGAPEPPDQPESCFGSMRCDDGKLCWKDQCVVERDVERFICDPPAGEMTELVPFMMPVVEFVTQQPPMDLRVLACRANDISCADPEGSFEDEAGMGLVTLELPYGFFGFLEVTSSDALPALWYFTQPLTRPMQAKPLRVVSTDTLSGLASFTGFEPQANKGLVILEAFDCSGVAVGGIYFEESKHAALPFFIVDGVPNTEATVTVRNDLTSEAPGGFLNATPGFTVFSARIGQTGPLLGEFNANVRASTITYLDIHP